MVGCFGGAGVGGVVGLGVGGFVGSGLITPSRVLRSAAVRLKAFANISMSSAGVNPVRPAAQSLNAFAQSVFGFGVSGFATDFLSSM